MGIQRKFAYLTAVAAMGTSVAQAQISDDTVKVGLLTDFSGPYAAFAGKGSEAAARMAVEDFGGKVNGKPIELLVADHQNKASVGATRAREWVDQENVDVFLEMINSAVALAVSDIAKEKGKVQLIIGGGTTRLTNESCHEGTVHWVYDTHAMASGTARALMDEPGTDKWFFITADYAFGHSLEEQTRKVVDTKGGEVLGNVRHPHPTTDFSSFILQAQTSGADVIALANAGPDFTNALRSASEFGVVQGGQKVAGMIATLVEVHSLGLDVAQGLLLTTGYYWDRNEESRAFAERFQERTGAKPNMFHAGTYSALSNYLEAIEKAGSDDRDKVMAALRSGPINDFMIRNGRLREDGRLVYDMYLVQAKSPSESEGEWDLYDVVRTIPGEQAYQPLSESTCELVD